MEAEFQGGLDAMQQKTGLHNPLIMLSLPHRQFFGAMFASLMDNDSFKLVAGGKVGRELTQQRLRTIYVPVLYHTDR